VNNLSSAIRGQINAISDGLVKSHVILREIAAVDMSEENLHANEHVRVVMGRLVEQNASVAGVLQQTASTTEKISQEVAAAIVAMQFQDLTSQRLGNVKSLLAGLADSLGSLHDVSGYAPDQDGIEAERERAKHLIEGCTLSEMRRRLADRILSGLTAAAPTAAPSIRQAPADGDGIEMF
jgi:methyl-accepting chemotaxis protein